MKIVIPEPLSIASVLSSNVAYPSASDPAVWNSATAYKIGDVCRIDYIIYEALKANTNISPATDTGDNWQEAGLISKYALIDRYIGSKSIATAEEDGVWKIECQIDFGDAVIDTLGLFGLDGKTLTVRQYDRTSNEMVREIVMDLQDESRVSDYSSYFFGPFYFKNDVVLPMALYRSKVTIILEKAGSPSKIGAVAAGKSFHLGVTQTEPECGINDYSKRENTLSGYAYLKKGRTARRQRINVTCPSSDQDMVTKLMTQAAGMAVIYITAGFFESNIIYGFCRSFGFYYSNNDTSYFSLDVESLI